MLRPRNKLWYVVTVLSNRFGLVLFFISVINQDWGLNLPKNQFSCTHHPKLDSGIVLGSRKYWDQKSLSSDPRKEKSFNLVMTAPIGRLADKGESY